MTIIDTTRRPRSVGRTVADPVPMAPAGTGRPTTVATYDPTARPDGRTLSRWGLDIELDGIASHEDVARIVAETARDAGIRPVLVQVLANPCEPAAARARAFGRLCLALSD